MDSQNECSNLETWSHVRETINMLYLAVCQIETTMADSNVSVDTLTTSFAQLANHACDVSDQIQNLTQPEELITFKKDIINTTNEMKSNVSASICAFQFYDRVCQRLDHVSRSLEKVSEVMSLQENLSKPDAWHKIQMDIKGSYTMEAERLMFDYIMQGGTVKEALEIYRQQVNSSGNKNNEDEIELF
ncbi:MAG: hypothetical protein RL497_2248 [Pseudomonadota bacterium]|jgi:hypothetical protein